MVNKIILLISIIAFLFSTSKILAQSTNNVESYPSVQLSNGTLDVLVFVPDKDKGYYRSVRFEWSGFMAQVTYKGHTFFQDPYYQDDGGPVPVKHDPLNTGCGTGIAEEFRNPLGYETAAAGEPFLKIGVGLLEKSDSKPYFFAEPYKIIKPGEWKVTHGQDWILFEQSISTGFGYAYQYSKKISLAPGQPEITVLHILKNTGTKMIASNPYCHNFFCFDKNPAGPDYAFQFTVPIVTIDSFKDKAVINGNSFRLLKYLAGSDPVGGAINIGKRNEFLVSNSKSGTKVFVKGDNPLSSFYIYIWKPGYCPEPMIDIKIEPGAKQEWTNHYRFEVD